MKDSKKPKAEPKKSDSEKVKDLTQLLQRLQAEFENYKKRTNTEINDSVEMGKSTVFEKLIPIIDHFELALKHKCADENYELGMKMIHGLLIDMLTSEHVNIIDPLGQKFDPCLHEAVGTQSEEDKDDNEILEVAQKGYTLFDNVLRRARVMVNQK